MTVIAERRGAIAVITLNRPERTWRSLALTASAGIKCRDRAHRAGAI
jgi:hypothetical protein